MKTLLLLSLGIAAATPSDGRAAPQTVQAVEGKAPAADLKDDAKAALQRGKFTQADGEYQLATQRAILFDAGRFGTTEQSTVKTGTVSIDIQLGTIEGKRAYVKAFAYADKAGALREDDVNALVGAARDTLSPSTIQACPDGTKCTKWCKNKQGVQYCCEYGCK